MTRIMPFLFLHPASQEFLLNLILWQANHANTISDCGLVFVSLKGAFDHKTLGFLGGANGRERLGAQGIDQAPS